MKHTRTVERYPGSLRELADDMGNLYYDSLADLLAMLAAKIEADSRKDERRGRVRLAGELSAAAQALEGAATHVARAWDICEPFTAERPDE